MTSVENVGSNGGCWFRFIIGRRFCLLLVRVISVAVVAGSAIYHSDIRLSFVVGCDIYGLFRSYLVVGAEPLKLDGGFVQY